MEKVCLISTATFREALQNIHYLDNALLYRYLSFKHMDGIHIMAHEENHLHCDDIHSHMSLRSTPFTSSMLDLRRVFMISIPWFLLLSCFLNHQPIPIFVGMFIDLGFFFSIFFFWHNLRTSMLIMPPNCWQWLEMSRLVIAKKQ